MLQLEEMSENFFALNVNSIPKRYGGTIILTKQAVSLHTAIHFVIFQKITILVVKWTKFILRIMRAIGRFLLVYLCVFSSCGKLRYLRH